MTEKKDLIKKDTDFVWHALTQYKKFQTYEPKIFTHAKESKIYDIDGKGYIDGVSGLWCVNVGYGRTGKMFGYQHWDVQPDIITFAKGLTSGYLPLSATAVKEEIFQEFVSGDSDNTFRHVNTFGGHPASCSVAIANIDLINELSLVEQAKEKGEYLLELLQDFNDLPNVGDIRGRGLFVGIEIVKDKKTKAPEEEEILADLINMAFQKGIIIGKNSSTIPNFSNVLIIAPPLTIENAELEAIVVELKTLLLELAGR